MSTPPASRVQDERRLRAFLCYASGDKAIVRELYRRLKAAGFEPWLDEEELLPGQEWQEEIPAAVRTCDVVIVCLSRKSVSKEGYLQREIRDVLYVAEEKPEGMIFVIPVRLEEVDVPKHLSKWQWANLFDEDGYDRLLLTLTRRAHAIGATVILSPLERVAANPLVPRSERTSFAATESVKKQAPAQTPQDERTPSDSLPKVHHDPFPWGRVWVIIGGMLIILILTLLTQINSR